MTDCPECGSPVELYDTEKNGLSGRYRCPECGKDSTWARVKTGIFYGPGLIAKAAIKGFFGIKS